MPAAPLSTTVVLVHQGPPGRRRERHDPHYRTRPSTPSSPTAARCSRRPAGHPQPPRRLVPQPPPRSLTGADACRRSCRRAVPRSTPCHAGTTRRWWAGPTSSPACWRTSSGRSAGRSSAVLLAGDAGVGKTRLLDELAAAGRRARCPRAHRALRRPRRRRAALPAVRRPAAPGRRRPDLAPVSSANPVLAGLLAGRARRRPPVPPATEGRDLGRPLPHRAAPQPVDDGRLQLFESVAGADLRAGRGRARC